MSKHQRQHRISRMLANQAVTSQEQLVGQKADELLLARHRLIRQHR